MKYLILSLMVSLFLFTGKGVHANDQLRSELSQRAAKMEQRADAIRAAKIYRARVQRVQTYLEKRNSPLSGSAESFIRAGDTYGIRPELLVAISGKESSFGRFTPKWHGESYNAWGWGIHQNVGFSNWSDGIFSVARGLSQGYRGLTLREIAYRYAPPVENNTEKWIADVRQFMSEI